MATNPNNVISQPGSQLTGLARQLVLNHLLDEAAAIKALDQARRDNVPFITYLVDGNSARAKDIAQLRRSQFQPAAVRYRSDGNRPGRRPVGR